MPGGRFDFQKGLQHAHGKLRLGPDVLGGQQGQQRTFFGGDVTRLQGVERDGAGIAIAFFAAAHVLGRHKYPDLVLYQFLNNIDKHIRVIRFFRRAFHPFDLLVTGLPRGFLRIYYNKQKNGI